MGVAQVGDISPRVSELRNKGILRKTTNKRQGKTGGKQGCHIWVPVEQRVTPTPGQKKPKAKSEKTSRDELLGVRPGVSASKIIATIVQRIRQQPSFVQFDKSQALDDSLASLNAFFELFSVRSHIPVDIYKRQRAKIFCAVAESPSEKKYAEALDSLYGERYRTCFAAIVAKGKAQ
jgi:hypothetical protein